MIHIIPINDLKDHIESSTCECSPFLSEENGEMILIHNSFDGRELIEQGYQKGLKLNGITSRDGIELEECDVIETIQGTKFLCVNYFGMRPHLIDTKMECFRLEPYMSPNIWKIGNIFDYPKLRNLFRK